MPFVPPHSAQASRSEESTASPGSFGPAAFLQSEGRARHARGMVMDYQTVFSGPDKRVPPKGGRDERVPPRGGYGRLSTLGHRHKLNGDLILARFNLHLLFLGN